MFINAKLNENMINKPNIRYSQTSLNSTQNSDLDYNLYCFSQGYENKEKGFWRGVLRNKNIDFDLKLDKEWNRRIELEDSLALSDAQSQISNLDTEIISIMNEGDMGWDKNLFQNFKKKQSGVKKQKNKEWLLSNGIKRAQGIVVELRTQNYKQFEENEKNKKLKKIQNEKPPQQKQELILDNSRYQYSEKAKKYNQAEYNQIKNYAGSDTKKTGASSTYNTLSDTKAYTKTVIKKNQYDVRSPLELSNKKYNKYQRSPRIEPMNNYGIKRQEIKIGQNYNNSNNITNKKKSDDQYVQAFTLDDRPKKLERVEVSVETLSFLHELGHHNTLDFLDPDEIAASELLKENLYMQDEETEEAFMQYFTCPEEMEATADAVDFCNHNPVIVKMFDKQLLNALYGE